MFVARYKAQERLAICKTCEYYKSLVKMCGRCNCFMPVKTTLSKASCPASKWSEFDRDPSITEKYKVEE